MTRDYTTALIIGAALSCAALIIALLLLPNFGRADLPARGLPARTFHPKRAAPPAPGDAAQSAADAISALARLETFDQPASRFVPAAVTLRLRAGEDRERATNCLALAIYYEARGEVRTGQEAVAQVVLNRVRAPIYPKTVCGVIFQGEERPTGCQFSFTCDGSMSRPPRGPAWALARRLAEKALDGFVLVELGGATNYHNQTVQPVWSAFLNRASEIGHHVFYTSDISLRSPYHGGEPVIPKALFAEINADGPLDAVLPDLRGPDPQASTSDRPSKPVVLAAAVELRPPPELAADGNPSSADVVPAPQADELTRLGASFRPQRAWFPATKLPDDSLAVAATH